MKRGDMRGLDNTLIDLCKEGLRGFIKEEEGRWTDMRRCRDKGVGRDKNMGNGRTCSYGRGQRHKYGS